MIRVRVELISATTGKTTELARMHIANDGKQSAANPRRGSYSGKTLIGRSVKALELGIVNRCGVVENHDRLGLHVWHLVGKMLCNMGYGK